tara:strand:- start:951 stop:1181 length:231 start_codon:yes stop_codon:yes gene_type:complete
MDKTITEQCILLLKREDVKEEFKKIIWSIIAFLLYELKNYVYFMVVFVTITFLMILSILAILIQIYRNQSNFKNVY